MADKDDVLALLRIADLSKNWPNLKPIHDHAMAALDKVAKEHAEIAAKAKEEADKAKAKEEADKAKAAGGKKGEEDEEETSSKPLARPGYSRG